MRLDPFGHDMHYQNVIACDHISKKHFSMLIKIHNFVHALEVWNILGDNIVGRKYQYLHLHLYFIITKYLHLYFTFICFYCYNHHL